MRLFPPGFPWRLFFRYTSSQLGVLAILLFLAKVSVPQIVLVLMAHALVTAWLGRSLFLPMGRLLERSRARPNLDSLLNPNEGALLQKEGSEWEDLETQLNEIRAAHEREADALAREREELTVLMGGISDAILAVDRDGRLLFFNSRFALLTGDRNVSIEKPTLRELFRNPELLSSFDRAIKEGTPSSVSLRLHSAGEDQARDFSVSITPLKKEDASVYGAACVFHDVTELKAAERMRIDFVANVSHELRTPLTAIKGYTDTLKMDVEEQRFDSAGKFLGTISQNVDRLMALIEDLLDLSSLESGTELNRTWIGCQEITTRILSQLDSRITQRKLSMTVSFGAKQVLADPRRLEQVLVNLIDNAVKYTPPGGEIHVLWEQEPGKVILRVKDTGPGVPAESQQRLFERFYRVDKARSREMGGTGLGLAIVKHIMQRHGGSIRVKSELGRGSEFISEFPTQ